MAIERACKFPAFYSYLTETALIPYNTEPSQELLALASHSCQWLEIPSFQRGIAWKVSDIVEGLLESESPIMGNVLLGQFQRDQKQLGHLPQEIRQYCVIIDGLQRFSISTALLASLYPLVLQGSPSFTADASYFMALKLRCANFAPVFQHNDKELSNHPRQAIAHAYSELRKDIENYLRDELESGNGQELAQKLSEVFLNKQVAIDVYHNFRSYLDMMSAFLGINTVRVDLGPVDLLRSFIVEKATESSWDQVTIESTENRITEIFTENNKPKMELLPFVFICLEQVKDDETGNIIFPSWSEKLRQQNVAQFLSFVEDFLEVTDNGYIREIRDVGALPLAGLLVFYYRKLLATNEEPSFFTRGDEENPELHLYLRGCYRAYFEGKVGKSRSTIDRLLTDYSLIQCAESLSEHYSGISLTEKYSQGRLKTLVERADIKKSKRVFNAMLLPESSTSPGGDFSPHVYGNKSVEYHIDHLIPRSTLDDSEPGFLNGDTICNFAPLPSAHNKNAKATPCSLKLTEKGEYGTYINSESTPHPYTEWLLDNQPKHGSNLDDQELLQLNSDIDIAGERLAEISMELLKRI